MAEWGTRGFSSPQLEILALDKKNLPATAGS